MRWPLADHRGAVKVGDAVYVRATVVQVEPENLLVGLFSKTDQYEAWVRPDLCELDLPELPDEPADRTMLKTPANDDGMIYVFERNDAEGHSNRDTRRHDRHWWSYVDSDWVDWPYVVAHGGGRAVHLAVVSKATAGAPPPDLDANERAVLDGIVQATFGWDEYSGKTIKQVQKMARHRGVDRDNRTIEAYLNWRVAVGTLARASLGGHATKWFQNPP